MRSWSAPDVPRLPVQGPEVRVWSSSERAVVPVAPCAADGVARLYVCGITPYDATHLGHAATYVAFDLLNRAWRIAGHDVRYVQNVTDVDDPLLERAIATGEDWTALAQREIALFRADMKALRILPPDAYVGAVESIPLVVEMVHELQARDAVYAVDDDLYFSVHTDPAFGDVSRLSDDEMIALFAERGGDPERAGKRNPLDCLLWQAERPDEPAWDTALGAGRPGWHIECAAIARHHLGDRVDVVGGGSDLAFPHHEMSAAEAHVVAGGPFATAYVHAGMVGLDGDKMSKSQGNLVFVSTLRTEGVDPAAIRLALLSHHYRTDWEWLREDLITAEARLSTWRKAVALDAGAPTADVVETVLAALAEDLDAPTAVEALHDWATSSLELAEKPDESVEVGAGAVIARLADSALGLNL